MRIDEQQERVVPDRFAFKIEYIGCIATQQYADTTHKRRYPFFLAHLIPAGVEPHHISGFGTTNSSSLKELRSAEDGMILPELNQCSREL